MPNKISLFGSSKKQDQVELKQDKTTKQESIPAKDTIIKKEPKQQKQVREPVIEKQKEPLKQSKPLKQNKVVDKDKYKWQSFDKVHPEIGVPCEFYVQTDKSKEYFYGYIADIGVNCTNDPYKMVVLRKKFNNLYYRELCNSILNCPNNFPNCENCKLNKE